MALDDAAQRGNVPVLVTGALNSPPQELVTWESYTDGWLDAAVYFGKSEETTTAERRIDVFLANRYLAPRLRGYAVVAKDKPFFKPHAPVRLEIEADAAPQYAVRRGGVWRPSRYSKPKPHELPPSSARVHAK